MVQRERAFLQAWGTTPIGSVILFKGRVTKVDSVGRTSAEITVASDLVLLDIDMPRNFYQPTCAHTLYDSGCGLVKSTFGAAGIVAAGSSASSIVWAGALPALRAGHAGVHVGGQRRGHRSASRARQVPRWR